ncbi:MAG TPA: hypothetical protein VF016_08090 [Nitrososphaera sp.]
MTEAQPKGKASKGKYIGIGVGVVIVAIIAVMIIGAAASNGGLSSVGKSKHSIQLMSGNVAVNPGHYQSYQFNVPSGATNTKVTGTFYASGGSGNDIVVTILSQTDYINWQNGHSSSTNYNSGKVTTGNINTNLPDGETYYLVFDNSFSIISAKNVSGNIQLEYLQ